jgi:hypothetical protein
MEIIRPFSSRRLLMDTNRCAAIARSQLEISSRRGALRLLGGFGLLGTGGLLGAGAAEAHTAPAATAVCPALLAIVAIPRSLTARLEAVVAAEVAAARPMCGRAAPR